ncbi:hypothetical protein CLU79DRAFT_731144 [Phycomyces nitens]|nr:hypothetical protein CLU79DRAFT_731144 [Phycomyces nitens]
MSLSGKCRSILPNRWMLYILSGNSSKSFFMYYKSCSLFCLYFTRLEIYSAVWYTLLAGMVLPRDLGFETRICTLLVQFHKGYGSDFWVQTYRVLQLSLLVLFPFLRFVPQGFQQLSK